MKNTLILLLICFIAKLEAQDLNIHELIQRTDLTLQEIEKLAEKHFEKVGKVRGTGYKQFERWRYEQQFHLREDGSFIPRSEEADIFLRAKPALQKANRDRAVNSWKELGPQSWTHSSGWNPGVGRLTWVATLPSDENTIYVSSPGGGIWKSTDAAQTWQPLVDTVNAAWMNVFCLAIDAQNPNNVYAGLIGGRVIKSADAGKNWVALGNGPNNCKKIVVHPDSSNIVFAASENGMFRSINGGESWNMVQSGNFQDIEFQPFNPNVLIASTSLNSIFRSENLGLKWQKITLQGSGRTLLAVSPNDSSVVYAVQANGNTFGRFYKSTDAGKTFKVTITGNPLTGTNFFGYDADGKGTGGQATYDMAICVNPNDVNEIHIAGIICWKSTDGGNKFEAETIWSYPNNLGYNHADVHGLEFVNNTIYSVSDGGIYKSKDNGDNWEHLSKGLGIRQLYKISCSKVAPSAVTGGAQDNGTTFRQANGSWLEWLGADGMDTALSPTDGDVAVGTSQYGSLYRTTDGGKSQNGISKPKVNGVSVDGKWVTPIALHPFSHDTLFAGYNGVYRTIDNGKNWTRLNNTPLLDVLVIAPSDPNYIYASVGTRIYRSTNGGITWSDNVVVGTITSICVSPSDPQKIWITTNRTSNNVQVSKDMGLTFTTISQGLPAIAARSVVVDDAHTEGLYVGMNIGVYYRDNVNQNWILLGKDLPAVAINEVELQQSSRKVRVGTYGRGVWETDMQAMPASVYAGKDVTLTCDKTSVTLEATGGIAYLWSTGETTASIVVNPLVKTTYTVTATMSDSTTTVDEVVVRIDNMPPNAKITPNGNLALDCKNTSVALIASGGEKYSWNDGTTENFITATKADTYNVTVTGTNGCTASQSISTTLLPNTYDTTRVNACFEYTWAQNKSVYQKSGTYSERKECHTHYLILRIFPDNPLDFGFRPCDTSNVKLAANQLLCFPNPTKDEVNVFFNLNSNATDVALKVYDMQGRLLQPTAQENLNAGNYSKRLDFSPLANGIYPVCLVINGKCERVERVMVLR